MLTGLANYLFGLNEFTDEELLEKLFKETPIKGADGDDWILVELQQQQKQLDSSEQSIGCPGDIEPGNKDSTLSNGLVNNIEDKENHQRPSNESCLTDDDGYQQSTNKSSVDENQTLTANNYPVNTIENELESEGEDDDDNEDNDDDGQEGLELSSLTDYDDAKNQATADKKKKRKSPDNNNHTGTMEGSWFVTPPPCFVSHKKSINKVSASPLEDILIEHPSISVFHSHTSSLLDSSFYPIPSQSSSSQSLVTTATNITSPSSSQLHSPCPTLHLLPSQKLRFSTSQLVKTVTVVSALALESLARNDRSNRGQRNGSSNNRNNNNNNNRLNDEAIHPPPRAGETQGTNLENHERNGHLSEITNHHLAPMQKAMNQGSQKYLKKSFLNRQNLVNVQSNRRPTRRQRCTQRPSGYSNNRKMC